MDGKLHGNTKEIHNNMLRIVAGQSLEEKVGRAPAEGIAKIEKSWWFDSFIMGIIVLNLIFLATDPTDIALDEQSSTRQNVYIFIDLVYVGEFIVRVTALNPAVYFRTAWMMFDFINAVEALFHLLLKLIGWIVEFNGGSIRPFLTTVFPVLQCIRTLKFFRIFNPYGLGPPFPAVLHTMDAIGETFDKVILIVAMIMIVMVTAALLSNIVFADSLNYRCIPDPSRDSSSWHQNVYNDPMYITYGAAFYNSTYNDRHCGFRSGAKTCEIGFNCTNIGIGFGGGIGSFAEPGSAFLANLTFITMRGWGNLFFALVDANGPALSFTLLLSCILIVTEIYVNMIAAVFSNNMRQVTTKELKEMISHKFPGSKDTTSELEMLIWAFNSGMFIETKLEEDKILTNTIKMLKTTFGNGEESEEYDEEDNRGDHEKKNEKTTNEKKKKKKKEEKGHRELVPGEVESDEEEEEVWKPNCKGCDNLRDILASDGGPLSIFVILFVFVDTLALAADSNNPSDDTIQAMAVINLTSTIVFIVDVVLRISVMGPYLFFDSSFNILDFTLVVFNCISFVTSSVGFVSNFRMLRLLRLMRLYKVAFLLKLKEGQAISDPALGLVRLLSLMMELGRPIIIYSVMLSAALFTMAVVGMQCFGTASSQLTEYDENFPGLTPLVLMWNGIFTERMIFTDFSKGFITLFNMSCLDGWYPVMYTFITSSGVVSTAFFITWIIVSNWLMQGLLTASIMMEMEKLAREYVLCASIGNKIVIHNIILIQHRQKMTVAFNLLAKFAAEADGHEIDNDQSKEAVVKEEKEKEPALPWLEAFFLERKSWRMYIVKPGGTMEKILRAIKHSAAFNLAVSVSVIVSVLQILNSSRDVNDTGRFYFPSSVWAIVDLVVFIVFLAEMFLEWCVSGIYSPWETCYFSNPVNWLEFIVNSMMVISIFVTDPAAKAIFKKFRIVRIAKLPGIITSFSSDRSLTTFLASISVSFTSLSSLVTAALSFVFFFGIIGVQVFKSLFNRCSYDLYPDGMSFYASSAAYPYGCDDRGSGNLTTVNYTSTYSGAEVLSIERPIDHFDNVWAGMLSVFRIFMLNEWQGIMYNGLDTTEKGHQPGDLTSEANFLFFVPVLLIGLVMLTLLIGIIYYHFIVMNTFTGYRVRQLTWAQWFSNEPKVMAYHKVIFGSREALWVTYEEMLPQVMPLTVPPRPSEYKIEPSGNFPGVPNPQYYIWLLLHRQSYKCLISCFFAFPLFLIIAHYSTTYGRNEWVYYDTIFSLVYLIEYGLRLYVYGPSSQLKTVVGVVDIVFVFILSTSFFYFFTHPTGDWGPMDRNFMKLCVIIRSFRVITAYETTQNMTEVARAAWSGFVPLFLYLFTTLLIYAVIGSLIFPRNTVSTGNEFIDAHYNFQTLRDGITTLLIMGTGNAWSEVISELDNGESTIHTFVTYFFFFSFYITIMIVFRLFSLMNIQKTRLQDYKTSILAQDQIREFQIAWQAILSQQSILNITDGTINIEDLYKLVSILPRPLGLCKEGQNSILFQDLDAAVRSILLSVPKAPEGKDDYAMTRSNFAFSDALLPDYLVGELMGRIDPKKIPASKRKPSIVETLTGGLVTVKSAWKFTFQEILIGTHRATIIQNQSRNADITKKARHVAVKHAATAKYFISSFLMDNFFSSKIDNPQSNNLLLLQRLDRSMFELLFIEIMTAQIDSLNNRLQSYGPNQLDSLVCSKLKACIEYHVHMAKLQYAVGRLLSEGSSDHLTEEHRRCGDAADFYSNVNVLKNAINSIYETNVSQLWGLDTLRQVSQITEDRKHITALHIDGLSSIYIGYSDGTIKIWKRKTHASLFVSKDTNFKKFQMIESEPGLYAITLSSDLKRLVAATERSLFLYLKDSRNASKVPMFKFGLKMTGHSQAVHSAHFHDSHLLSASADGTIKLWAGSTAKPHPLRSASTGAPVNSICIIKLLNYIKNSETQMDKYAVTHAVCGGCANGDVALYPLPVDRSTIEITWWSGKIIRSSDLKLQMTISCLAIAWNFLYIGYVDGSICVYAIKIDSSDVPVFFNDEFEAMNKLNLVYLKTYHVHSGPITGIKMAGGYLFTSSRDMSIMKWHKPLNLEADAAVEWSQSHGEAMVVHTSPILALSANKYCMISGDESGKMVITSPDKTVDSLEDSSPKVSGEPCIDFNFVSHDFGPVYLPTQGVMSIEEKILRIHNRSNRMAVVRRVSANNPAFQVDLMAEQSICAGSTLTAYEDESDAGSSSGFNLDFMGGIFGSQKDEGKAEVRRMDVVNIEPNQYAFYKISFLPSEQKRYSSKTDFIINDGEQHMTIHYYGKGEKIAVVCTPMTSNLVDFGECVNGQIATSTISLTNGGSRPLVVHACDCEIETKLSPGEEGDGSTVSTSTMSDKNIAVVPHATYLWPGKSFQFSLYYEPAKGDPGLATQLPSFKFPIQFAFNGQLVSVGECVAQMTSVDDEATKEERLKDERSRKAKLENWLKQQCLDEDKTLGMEDKDIELFQWSNIGEWGKEFSRTQSGAYDYEDIIRCLHHDAAKTYHHEMLLRYSRAGLYSRGTRQLLLYETHVTENFLHEELRTFGWRFSHDQEMMVLLHNSGLFMEVLMKNFDKKLSPSEEEAMNSICLNLKFYSQCNYKVLVGDSLITEGITGNGIMNMFKGNARIFINGSDLIYRIMKGRSALYDDKDKTDKKSAPDCAGLILMELHVWDVNSKESDSKCIYFVDVCKGYRIVRDMNGSIKWYDRIYVKGIRMIHTNFNRQRDDEQNIPWSVDMDFGDKKFNLTGHINERFGIREDHGKAELIKHRGRPHCFPCIRFTAYRPERYNKFMIVDSVSTRCKDQNSSQSRRFEWFGSFGFPPGETEHTVEVGRPDLSDFEMKWYKSLRLGDDPKVIGNDEEYHPYIPSKKEYDHEIWVDDTLTDTNPNSSGKVDPDVPFRAVCLQAKYKSDKIVKESIDQIAYINHEVHYGRGTFARTRVVNEMLDQTAKRRRNVAITSALKTLEWEEIQHLNEETGEVVSTEERGVRHFDGLGQDDIMRKEGLIKAAESIDPSFDQRRIHHRRVLPRSVYSSRRKVSCRSAVFSTDKYDMSGDCKEEQRKFELLMDYLSFSNDEPPPKNITVEDDGYFAWLYNNHHRYYLDQVLGDNWAFVKDHLGIRILATASSEDKCGVTVVTERTSVTNVSHIQETDNAPGEIILTSSGCAITTKAKILKDRNNEKKLMTVHFDYDKTIRICDAVVLQGPFKISAQGESVQMVNRSPKSLHWYPPPRNVTHIYHLLRRNQMITRMYDLIHDYLVQENIKAKREKEKVEGNDTSAYDGVVTKEMKEAARLRTKDDEQIGHKEVYNYLTKQSHEFSLKIPTPVHHTAIKSRDGDIDVKKLDLGKLCHYLMHIPLPGFEEPFEEPVVHLMLQDWEDLRDSGIALSDFKSFIIKAGKATGHENSVDHLDGENVFAFLLEEENIKYRGHVFAQFKAYDEENAPRCPHIAASINMNTNHNDIMNGVSAKNLRKHIGRSVKVDHYSVESTMDAVNNNDEKEEIGDIGNVIVSDANVAVHEVDDVGPSDVKDDGTAETNANTSINADEVASDDDVYNGRDEKEVDGVTIKEEPGLFNLFGLW